MVSSKKKKITAAQVKEHFYQFNPLKKIKKIKIKIKGNYGIKSHHIRLLKAADRMDVTVIKPKSMLLMSKEGSSNSSSNVTHPVICYFEF